MTVQKFFQDNLEAVYKLRLGVDCLEVYNLERSAEELQRRLAEKDSELGRAEGEVAAAGGDGQGGGGGQQVAGDEAEERPAIGK